MHESNLATEQRTLIDRVQNAGDFAGAYLAVRALHGHIREHGPACGADTAIPLENLIRDQRFSSETQAFFLYREAAEVLVALVKQADRESVRVRALNGLNGLLSGTRGHPLRATAEALAALPVMVQGPEMTVGDVGRAVAPTVTWTDIVAEVGCRGADEQPRRIGRSLIRSGPYSNTVLVVKCACRAEDVELIRNEVRWMVYLRRPSANFDARFDVPEPIRLFGNEVFELAEAPEKRGKTLATRENRCWGIAFVADQDYFVYPNEPPIGRRPEPEWFLEVISRNAYLFGRLCACGIVHQAPIPLFHNRIQRFRRQDRGLYEWYRGGRLDQWLSSCRYPNFGPTGVRDFEHFISFSGTGPPLYHHIGSHLLALLLTGGSYFRFKDTARIGTDAGGAPVDARDLFDPAFFQRIIEAVFRRYYHGFTGYPFHGDVPFDTPALVHRMIEEMGVDRYMEEILRVADQQAMSDEAFFAFLIDRGYPEGPARRLKKAQQDIILHTGPHLGGFNERVSIPELIDAVAAMAASCIAGRYVMRRRAGSNRMSDTVQSTTARPA